MFWSWRTTRRFGRWCGGLLDRVQAPERQSSRAAGCASFEDVEPLEPRRLLSVFLPQNAVADALTSAEITIAQSAPPLQTRAVAGYATSGVHPYFRLKPGCIWEYKRTYTGGSERIVRTVSKETKVVNGVLTRVVKEDHYDRPKGQKEKLDETWRLYLAINKSNGDLVLFGEVERYFFIYGWMTDRWLAGQNGNTPGIYLPGHPSTGMIFTKENADNEVDVDCQIQSTTATVRTPAGTFKKCLKVWTYNPTTTLGHYNYFAPGVGEIITNGAKLTKFTRA